MSDGSSLAPNNPVGLTNDCLFNLKPNSVRSRTYRASIPAMNSQTFVASTQMIFSIPCGRRNSYLDNTMSYLKFTVYNPDTVTTNFITIDNNAANFIDRLDVFHSSTMLETIQTYGPLYTYLTDFQMTPSAKQGLSTMYGFSKASGSSSSVSRAGLPIYGGQSLTFCIPILSGCIGLGCDKLFPIGILKDDIRLEFSLTTNNVAVVYSQSTTSNVGWIITSAELQVQIVELSDEGQAIVESVTPSSQPIFIHGQSFRHYSSIMPALQTGSFSYLVSARFGSLKNLIVLPRRSTELTSATSYSCSSRINPNISQYYWRIGGYILPSKPIILQQGTGGSTNVNASRTDAGYSMAYTEIVKSFHSLNSAWLASGLGSDCYNVADSADLNVDGASGGLVTAATTGLASYSNGFAIGTELEVFPNRGDTMISGFNTMNSQIYFEGNINSNSPVGSAAYQLDFYACFDSIFEISNGLITERH